MSPLSNHAKGTYIAPELSAFAEAYIPDMRSYSSQASHWLDNHVLNVMLRGSWKPPLSTCVFNFLRGSTIAVWLTNEELKSVDVDLSFVETGGILVAIPAWPDAVCCGRSQTTR